MLLRLSGSCLGVGLLILSAAAQPSDQVKQAEGLLRQAQQSYNEGKTQAAIQQFSDYLAKFSDQKNRSAARLGLALALLDMPQRDYPKAMEQLTSAASDTQFTDRPLALYYLAVCQRGLGLKEQEAKRADAATARFRESALTFQKALEAFNQRKGEFDAEWVARCRCDQAEAELRLRRAAEARTTVEPLIRDAAPAVQGVRPLALYYHGVACFLQGDYSAAGRSLGLAAASDHPHTPHARYLLGRVLQASEEKAEAALTYEAVIAGYEKQKKDAAEALKQPQRFANDPWEKARLEALVREPPPEYVQGAIFYSACLLYEAGRFGEALPRFQSFAKDYAQSPLAPDAVLRAGYCLVQLKQYDAAVKLLQPLAGQHRRLADQALYWLGKAQHGLAQAIDPNNKSAREQAYQASLTSLRTAAARAAELAEPGKDPSASERRIDILIELADVQASAGLVNEAAQTYETAYKTGQRSPKAEEVLSRLVGTLQIAANHSGVVYWAGIFEQRFPKSPLLPEVLFRKAESFHARAVQLAQQRDRTAEDHFEKAQSSYRQVIEKYPEYERVHRARLGLAVLHASRGNWEQVAEVIESIPAADRTGDVASANFLLAESLIRTAPDRADDALADNMLREKLGNAITLLEALIAAHPKAAEAPESLLKLGYCYKRLAMQLLEPKEKQAALAKARAYLERLAREFPQDVTVGQSILERARVKELQGDRNGALADLQSFTTEARRNDPITPIALVAYATLLRELNRPAEAVKALKEARDRHESALSSDPSRVEFAHLLRFHHALALLESGSPQEARPLFEMVASALSQKPLGAEAVVMGERAQLQVASKKLAQALAERQKPGQPAGQTEAAEAQVRNAQRDLLEQARRMELRADTLKSWPSARDAAARLFYEAAWAYRALAPSAPLNPNAPPMSHQPDKGPQTKEILDRTTAAYARVIATAPDALLAVQARYELAEIESDLGNPEAAIKRLREALDVEPSDRPAPPEFTDKIRLRLGVAEFERQQYAAAQAQFEVVASNPQSPLRGQALYRLAECLLARDQFEEAKNTLKPFRDDAAMQQIAGVSDRAMLRLAHAYAALKNWESSRAACETLLSRYGQSPWRTEALYALGWALANLGRHEEAVSRFSQLVAVRTDDLANRAHLQIGLCKAAQRKFAEALRAFEVVIQKAESGELRWGAMLEAARVLNEDNKAPEATKLLETLLKEAPPDSDWAKAARERLKK